MQAFIKWIDQRLLLDTRQSDARDGGNSLDLGVTELFEIVATRSDANHDWRIELVPRNQRMKKFVERMVVSGTGSTVTRIRTVQSANEWQEMILDSIGRE